MALVSPSAAGAEEVVNVTINIPADVRPNPCTPGDVVNLSGRLHIVYYVRSDNAGGFQVNQLVDEKASGTSLTTGTLYRLSDTLDHSWYARPPFPANDTLVRQVELVSLGESDNLYMRYRLHTTVTATGTPTPTLDRVDIGCAG